jgi:hypothetical protein
MTRPNWKFRAGARAAFGTDKFSPELWNNSRGYRAGYTWAQHKIAQDAGILESKGQLKFRFKPENGGR